MLYAYFAAVIRYIQASPRLPSIESAITNRMMNPSFPLDGAVTSGTPSGTNTVTSSLEPTSTKKRDVHPLRQEENTTLPLNQSFGGVENKTANRKKRERVRAKTVMGNVDPNHSGDESHKYGHDGSRPSVLTDTAPVVDLTVSDTEENLKCEPDVVPDLPPTDLVDHHPVPLAKQRLLGKLQSKKVHEIEEMLEKRAGLLPNWIERTMREEMEKKMTRDLEAIENLF